MKMKHRDTGEIVFLIGYVVKPTKGVYARCLCDARLHPDRKGRGHGDDTVEMEIAAHMLRPVEKPDWNEIEALYPPTQFKQILRKRQEDHVRNINSNAYSVYMKERAELVREGVSEDEAERMANEKKDAYVKSRLESVEEGKADERSARW